MRGPWSRRGAELSHAGLWVDRREGLSERREAMCGNPGKFLERAVRSGAWRDTGQVILVTNKR